MNAQTVLVAEDNDDDFILMQFALGKVTSEHNYLRARNGVEVIQYLRGEGVFRDRQRYPFPDLLLLDLKMPGKTGLEVLRWIREQPAFNQLIVTILSSSNRESDVTQAYDAHANSYLIKPANFEAFVTMVQKVEEYWLKLNTTNRMCEAGSTSDEGPSTTRREFAESARFGDRLTLA